MSDKLSQTELQAIQAVFSGSNTNAVDGIDKLSETLESIFTDRLGYKIDLYFIDSKPLENDVESIDLEISNTVNRELLSKEYSRKAYASASKPSHLEKHIFSKIQNNVSKQILKASALLDGFENNESATLYRFNFEDQMIKISVPANYFKSRTADLAVVTPITKKNVVVAKSTLAEKINANLALYFEDAVIAELTQENIVSVDIDSLNFEIFNTRDSLKVSTYAYLENINLDEIAKKSFEVLAVYPFYLVVDRVRIETGEITIKEGVVSFSISTQHEMKGA